MSEKKSQFVETLEFFRDHLLGHPEKLTYEEWLNADADDQAALLYVRFYPEISLAWYKMIVSREITYVDSADGVSTVLQYLLRNVEIIKNNPSAFSSEYIYTVAWRCIGCLPRNKYEKTRSEVECSNEYVDGDVEVDLFDLVPSEDADYATLETIDAFWLTIGHMGPKAEKVVSHLINGHETLHRVPKKSTERPIDRLADVTVSDAEYKEILEELKVKLAPFKDLIYDF